MDPSQDPLRSALPAEVPLPAAPLVRVIAQVRFPQILSIEKREFVAPFQEAIRDRYPALRPEQSHRIIVGPRGASTGTPQVVWRFSDVDENWRVSLAPDFAAIETTAYESREDFFNRFGGVIEALSEHVSPRLVDRVGVRYIDRVTGDGIDDIHRLVRAEVLGLIATSAAQHVRHSVSENVFAVPETGSQLMARWGLIPAGGTVDPAAIEAINERSWILDLDMYRTESRPFEADEIVDEARSFAERIYTFFRWTVTDEFLRMYGGKV